MPSNKAKGSGVSQWLLLAVWAGALLVGLTWLNQQILTPFDPEMKLHRLIDTGPLYAVSNGIDQSTGPILLDISESRCHCNQLSLPHRQSVMGKAADLGFRVETVNVDNLEPALAAAIPATPAVVLLSSSRQLVYAGPYASGAFCSPGNGLVEPWLTAETQALRLGPALVSDADGCYCRT